MICDGLLCHGCCPNDLGELYCSGEPVDLLDVAVRFVMAYCNGCCSNDLGELFYSGEPVDLLDVAVRFVMAHCVMVVAPMIMVSYVALVNQ